MTDKVDPTAIVAIVGAVTGIGGLCLGIVNLLRDSSALRVVHSPNVLPLGNPQYSRNIDWGEVTVINAGRRPVYLVAIDLILDSGTLVFLFDTKPKRLEEGSEPAQALYNKDELAAQGETVLCARARDASGRKRYSRMSLRNRLRLSWLQLTGKISSHVYTARR